MKTHHPNSSKFHTAELLAVGLMLVLFSGVIAGCNAPMVQAQSTATSQPAPIVRYDTNTPTATITLTPTITPTVTPSPTPTSTPFPTKDPEASNTPVPTFAPFTGEATAYMQLGQPIPGGFQTIFDPNYRYATTQNGAYRPHHGVDYANPEGTPVIAAAAGKIIYAGPDWDVTLGPNPFFYGNVVVILHDITSNGQPVYTLYGHLASVSVSAGQLVGAGELVGLVGGTGVALGGAHLHFEVRVGFNDYFSTRNPELWLRPIPRWGTLAGRVTDEDGNLVPIVAITVRSLVLDDPDNGPVARFTVTYAPGTTNPDDLLGENFVVMDLPPGNYQVTVNNGTRTTSREVLIRPNQLGWVEFREVEPPPTWTPTPSGTPPTATATLPAPPSDTPTP